MTRTWKVKNVDVEQFFLAKGTTAQVVVPVIS
jgi:hypothetical protein